MADFDQDKPAANTSLRVSNPQILDNQEALQDAINREHIFSGTSAGTQTGDHTQGSARAFSQATAPATRIDGDGFLSTDLGSIWFDTDDNKIYTLTATLPTWTPISTELYESFLADPRVFLDTLGVDGDFEVGTGSEFTVEAATGNVATDGTLDVAGAAEVVGIATLGDASTLKTAAAPTADAEITNKKYVDDGGQKVYARLFLNGDQSVATVNLTKVELNDETFDSGSIGDPTTNNRITPNKAGYYIVIGQLRVSGVSSGQNARCTITKNGSSVAQNITWSTAASNAFSIRASDLIFMNGSTDYFELVAQSSDSSYTITGDTISTFLNCMLQSK